MRSRLASLVLRASGWTAVGEVPRTGVLVGRSAHVQLGLRDDAAHHVARRGQRRGCSSRRSSFAGRSAGSCRDSAACRSTATTPAPSCGSSCARPAAASRSCSSSRRRAPAPRGSTGSPASGASRGRRSFRSPWLSSTGPLAQRDSVPPSRRRRRGRRHGQGPRVLPRQAGHPPRAAHRAAAARGAGRRGQQQLPARRVCRRPHLPEGARAPAPSACAGAGWRSTTRSGSVRSRTSSSVTPAASSRSTRPGSVTSKTHRSVMMRWTTPRPV